MKVNILNTEMTSSLLLNTGGKASAIPKQQMESSQLQKRPKGTESSGLGGPRLLTFLGAGQN